MSDKTIFPAAWNKNIGKVIVKANITQEMLRVEKRIRLKKTRIIEKILREKPPNPQNNPEERERLDSLKAVLLNV
jgi:hypothetical protein